MKKRMSEKVLYILLVVIGTIVVSCYQPSPLTGTWADNRGDQIALYPDYSFTAKIKNSVGQKRDLKGSYNVLLNALAFTAEDGYQVVSEWDIRGNMLYLEWPDDKGTPLTLILYKTKN